MPKTSINSRSGSATKMCYNIIFYYFFVSCNSSTVGITNVVIVGVFSPASGKQEIQVGKVIKSIYPEVSMTLSHEVGLLGLLERENASVLNESLKPLCRQTVEAFCDALKTLGLKCPFYLTQNDGTVIRYSHIKSYTSHVHI